MKRQYYFFVIMAATALLAVSSCKKYEDGPAFSLSSKTNRLSNTYWYLEQALNNDTDITYNWAMAHECLCLEYSSHKPFEKEQTYKLTWLDYATEHGEEGKFRFSDDKKYIVHSPEIAGGPVLPEYQFKILRLTKKEFWFIDERSGYEIHMNNSTASKWCGFY